MTDPAETSYEAVPFTVLPGWAADDHHEAFLAFCATSVGVVAADRGSGKALTQVCLRALAEQDRIGTREAARAFFETHFEPARVIHAGSPSLLTGYYEPVIDGSVTREPPFVVPIYRRPPDLENIVTEAMRSTAGGGYSHMRRTASGLEPYATREEIERGALAGRGLELVYLSDQVAAFFLHVQGSGAIQLGGGTVRRITYDGKNGHPYTSVGRTLIEDGTFRREDMTLQALSDWLSADLERARTVLWRNTSFVFFKFLDAAAPIGVMGTPLSPLRSLAIDPAFHELGSPVYVSAPAIKHAGSAGFHRLMVAADVGSAIKGPERGDIFFGTGAAALEGAGITKHPGAFFVLRPRSLP